MFSMKLTLITINIIFITKPCFALQCMDETGSPVDWFIVYKVPKLETSSSKTLNSGFGYAFTTDKTIKTAKDWTLSEKQINEKDSLFGQTIGPLIESLKKSSNDLSYVVYNDQTPDTKSSGTSAHSKGVFGADPKGVFWLTHSVPRFPDLTKAYDFPDSARHNGQTALCISIGWDDIKSLDTIATHLLIMRPKIYGIEIRDILSEKSDLWRDLYEKKWIKRETTSQMSVYSKKGLVFTTFAKSSKYTEDLYSGFIANYFKEDLFVQSWRNGAGSKLDSDCTDKYKVQNIDKIQFKSINKIDWNSTEDHSKWLITSDSTGGQRQTCISDINRMKSQFKRGGGSVCIDSSMVWKIFQKSVEAVEGCHLKTKKSRGNG